MTHALRRAVRAAALLVPVFLAVPAPAQDLPRANDLASQAGLVFRALAEGGATGGFASPRDSRRVAEIRRALQPFRRPLAIGGEQVVLNQTGLTSLAAAWGSATAHGEGEVAVRVACWASATPGTQVALVSALESEPPFRINGWSLASEAATPAGCAPTPRLAPGALALPRGLGWGASPAAAERAIGLRPTRRRPGELTWSYDLPAAGPGAGWTETVQLRLVFTDRGLSALAFTALVSN
ncbi:hypothetical protein ACE7GA_01280 [Roseomonas sp. CCTCC AB2023176]|uniref:hypothetical protein n=1 Tax=Roseomonas sp. CCTCC AB2023176 TaxID=3342640 RepID=UPI0035E0CB32